MQLQVKQWGNSAAIRLPQAILAQLKIQSNDSFEVEVKKNALLLKPIKKRYKLSDLVKEMKELDEIPMIEDWDNMPAVGLEKI